MIYAVGDVHGEADALRALLASCPSSPPTSSSSSATPSTAARTRFDCIAQIIAFDRCRKVFIQGNHEEALLIFLEEGAITALTGMDAQATLDSYAAAGYALVPGDPPLLPDHLRLYAQAYPWTLPFYITDDYIFTHAGWDLALPLQMQSTGALRWGKVTGSGAAVLAADRRARPHAVSQSHLRPDQAVHRRGHRLRHRRLSVRRRPALGRSLHRPPRLLPPQLVPDCAAKDFRQVR